MKDKEINKLKILDKINKADISKKERFHLLLVFFLVNSIIAMEAIDKVDSIIDLIERVLQHFHIL